MPKLVALSEGYREQHGIADRHSAIGERPRGQVHEHHWEEQRRQLQAAQQALEMRQAA